MIFPKRVTALLLTLMIFIGSFSICAKAEGVMISGIGFVKTDGLNLRQQPNTQSQSLATANAKECVVVIGRENDWYHVVYNLQEGYMHADYLTVSNVENAELGNGRVTANSVNLRSGPGTDCAKVGTASYGESLYIIGLNQGWYKVLRDSGTCYIRSDYLALSEIPYENRSSANSPKYFHGGVSIGALPAASTSSGTQQGTVYSGNATGAQILAKAQQYLGTPYVYGGASPSGFDCSGFVYYVLGTFGISAARTPDGQAGMGRAVSKSELQPGDIVLFAGTGGSGITHSGLYAGNGQFIHSPNSRSTVSYSDLTSGYWSEHFYAGRRVV